MKLKSLLRERYEACLTVYNGKLPDKNHVGDLESLESLQRLQSLESLRDFAPDLKAYSGDYRDVPIPPGAVVYCDIPYKGTDGYGMEFDYEAFYSWARRMPNCFVSEYWMPEGFIPWEIVRKRVTLCATDNTRAANEILWKAEK